MVGVLSDWFFFHVNGYPTGQGKSHNQRRAHQKIGADVLVDTRFKIAVAG